MSPPTTGLQKKTTIVRPFRRKKVFYFIFYAEAGSVYPKACLKTFRAKYSARIDCLRSISSRKIQRQESILHRNKITRQLRKLRMFRAKQSKCPRRFLEIDPEIWYTYVFNVPLPCRLRMGLYFCFSSLEMWDLSRPKHPKEIQKPKYLAKKNKYPKQYKNPHIWRKKANIPNNTKTQISGEKKRRKKPIRKRLSRGTSNPCANFRVTLKNGVDVAL